jgi:hypothetical protein
MKALTLIALLAALTACATVPMDPAHLALAQQQLAQATLEIDCPAGCSIKYRDPRDQLQLPNPVTGAQAARDIGVALVQQTPVLGLTGLGLYGFRKMSDLGAAGFMALQGSGAVTTTTTDARVTTSTDNSIDYSGNRGRIGSNDDYTHTPMVVLQPEPVVVPPTIVTQPAPLVVIP